MENLKKITTDNFIFLWELIKTKWLLIIILFVFFLGLAVGFVLPSSFKLSALNWILNGLPKPQNNTQLFTFIFFNNVKVLFMTLVFGFSLIIPLITTFINSFSLSILLDFFLRLEGMTADKPLILFLASLLPHGIIEIPLMIISAFISVLVPLKIVFSRQILGSFSRKNFLIKTAKLYIFTFVPLIFAAALIESFLSYNLTLSIFPMIIKDQTLNNLILSKKDLNLIKADARETEIDKKNNKIFFPFQSNQLLAYLYDDDLYNLFKNRTKSLNSIYKIYFFDKKSYSIISISQYASREELSKESDRFLETLNLISGKNKKINIIKLNDDLYQVNTGGGIDYLKFGRVKNYFVSIAYRGRNLQFLNEIYALQNKKLGINK